MYNFIFDYAKKAPHKSYGISSRKLNLLFKGGLLNSIVCPEIHFFTAKLIVFLSLQRYGL